MTKNLKFFSRQTEMNRKTVPHESPPHVDLSSNKSFTKEDSEAENMKFPIDLENWMGQLPYRLTKTPLIYLSIPGSHNSFSYSLSPSSGISPDSPDIVQSLGRWLKPVASRIVYNWSMGQQENVLAQLSNGIRYFDIRLVNKNEEIHISHGLYGGYIQVFLQEMQKFLASHPKEVVILDFQHFYKFNTSNHQFVTNLIQQIFGSKICPRRMLMRDITLDQLWRYGYQVMVIYRHSTVNYTDLLWPSGSWITAWPNKIRTSELLDYLDKGITARKEDVGYVSQGILTPTPKYVVLHIGGTLKKLALRNNKKLSRWLDSKSNGKKGVNVVICDFVETYNFCDRVVRLNYKSIENGEERKSPNQD